MSNSEALRRGLDRGRRDAAATHREPMPNSSAARLAQHLTEYEQSRPEATKPAEGESALDRGARLGRDRAAGCRRPGKYE